MTASTSSPTRGQRRKEQTRRSLLDATFEAISERGVEATTIAEIAERADVAFGSFYNHFASKDAIIEAAVTESIARYGDQQADITADIDDPARVIAVATRLAMTKATGDPLWGWFMVRTSMSIPHLRSGLGEQLCRDVERGVSSGRFMVRDVATALAAIGGAMLHVVEATLDGSLGEHADEALAESVLRVLGVDRDDAAAIASEPLDVHAERLRDLGSAHQDRPAESDRSVATSGQ